MAFERILIVDDEPIVRHSLREVLRRRNYLIQMAGTLQEARTAMAEESPDLVFTDLRLPDGNGADFLRELASAPEAPFVVVMTGYGSVEDALRCIRMGAFDYILKPFNNDQIEIIVRKAEEFRHLVRVNRFLSQGDQDSRQLIGQSAAIGRVNGMIARVAPTDTSVLILGESGTGKEMIAAEIHRQSARSSKPFIKVNCAAISETLIESEFFGHERGAFTGAVKRREGRFELASGGTILLDEISEISPGLQAKLLRVLQEKEFERVGGNATITCDVRVLATTNRNLRQAVEAGTFREDLFYRLNVFPIHNPPLRERGGDVVLLAEHFLTEICRKHGLARARLSAAATEALLSHRWPGNVRELQNAVERAVILTDESGLLQPEHFGLAAPGGRREGETGAAALTESDDAGLVAFSLNGVNSDGGIDRFENRDAIPGLAEVERRCILAALLACQGNRTHAARSLGISLRSLRNKISQYREAGFAVPEHGSAMSEPVRSTHPE